MILVHYVSLCRGCVLEHAADMVTGYDREEFRCDGCGYGGNRTVCRIPVNERRTDDGDRFRSDGC